jgi:hypothetical protein
MDSGDIKKIEEIISDRKMANSFFLKNSKVYESFVDLEKRHFPMGSWKKGTKN